MDDSITHYVIEYIWIGGNNELRSKIKVIHSNSGLKKIPDWNFDGSSTNQAKGNDSEVIIKPRANFQGTSSNKNCVHIYALCDTYIKDLPHPTNNRQVANAIFNADLKQEPWFGLEQEYFIIKKDGHHGESWIPDVTYTLITSNEKIQLLWLNDNHEIEAKKHIIPEFAGIVDLEIRPPEPETIRDKISGTGQGLVILLIMIFVVNLFVFMFNLL